MARPQCSRCCRPVSHCLCPLIPDLANHTRLLILQHRSEAGHALNTARLAALGLRNAQLWIGEHFDGLEALLEAEAGGAALLFPGEQDAPRGNSAPIKPRLLVVPDGSWRKARKILHLHPCLGKLPRLCLPSGQISRYRLRKAPMAGALSTIEAVTLALNMLEAPARFDDLLRPFEALIEGQIAAMGEETFLRNHGDQP
ncbi:tRNA-uridine aminocarboxypropyltransferase [Stutzerimonas kirkiae]|uniref:tRNA-uridine aminocarboxypropyltransferase n=1 Tax=Stutzerimonas kirkiae TaxID=2211392 RepID=UPI00103850FB|nr:DTW domain-containing protein [Stutzerimonas kirkiae]TBV09789.1 DTW domain-containing protein [Stutzerimonas kirkiae]TBV13481.1 DTW domain-containing protein [Stutzerimonas kirkiae]